MAKINTNSNVYTIVYATVLVVIVALLLAVVSAVLLPRQEANVQLDKKKQILASLNERGLSNADAENAYEEQVSAQKCDKCGLEWFEANLNGEVKYIIPVRGAGLWGPIWGYIALDADKNTIFGTYFDHESETPGLGGEIKTDKFQTQFAGKQIIAADGSAAIGIMKAGQTAEGMDQVDAISGATITSKGVETMIATSLKAYKDAGWFGNEQAIMPIANDANNAEVATDNAEATTADAIVQSETTEE